MNSQYSLVSSDIDEDYFLWLCSKIDGDDPEDGYISLLRILHDCEFNSRTAALVANDMNRISDGVELRLEYEEETQNPLWDMANDSCSCLELIVALAYRISSDLGGQSAEDWFWEMVDNLGLANVRITPSEVRTNLRIFRKRKYDSNGFGGLFPLREPRFDQRNVEIWFQMQEYFSENYG